MKQLYDRGLDDDKLRNWARSNGGVEVFCIKGAGKLRRVVDDFFTRVNRFRGTCTSYDRCAETCISFVCLASIRDSDAR